MLAANALWLCEGGKQGVQICRKCPAAFAKPLVSCWHGELKRSKCLNYDKVNN
jgi:hypothetical protein